MNSVRDRIEAKQLAEKYAARLAPQNERAKEAERMEKLAANARKIREDKVNTLLLDMTPDEGEVVFQIIGRERPECLGNADVIATTLLRVQTEGQRNLREAMQDTTRDEQQKVWNVLKDKTPEEKLGMDGGAACREALRQVRSDAYLED